MLEEKIANNLKKPIGIFGNMIGKMLKGNLLEYRELEKIISFDNMKNVLEIGYGPGYGLKQLCKRYECNFVGVDFSESMLKTASRRNRTSIKKGRIKLYCSDFEKWSNDGKKYDLIFFLNVIYFWEEIESKIKKVYELLNTNGKIAIFMTTPKQMLKSKVMQKDVFIKHEIETVVDIMSKIGFRNIEQLAPFKAKEYFFLIGEK
jgi:cyclopropane fatty-acyl-phospholipid synthase-like methyltransferase